MTEIEYKDIDVYNETCIYLYIINIYLLTYSSISRLMRMNNDIYPRTKTNTRYHINGHNHTICVCMNVCIFEKHSHVHDIREILVDKTIILRDTVKKSLRYLRQSTLK